MLTLLSLIVLITKCSLTPNMTRCIKDPTFTSLTFNRLPSRSLCFYDLSFTSLLPFTLFLSSKHEMEQDYLIMVLSLSVFFSLTYTRTNALSLSLFCCQFSSLFSPLWRPHWKQQRIIKTVLISVSHLVTRGIFKMSLHRKKIQRGQIF